MAKQKTPTLNFVTPLGVAVYPRLNKPDTKFDAEGVYKVNLRLDPTDEAVSKLLEKLTDFGKANNGIKNLPWVDEADDDGKPTGYILLKLKVKAFWPAKDGQPAQSRKPAIVDGGKNPITETVGGGSVIRVSGEARPYEGFGGGVSLAPLAVQVKELVVYKRGVDDFDVIDDAQQDAFDGSDEGAAGADEPEF